MHTKSQFKGFWQVFFCSDGILCVTLQPLLYTYYIGIDMKKICLLCFLMLLELLTFNFSLPTLNSAWAAPSMRVRRTVFLTNGSPVTVTLYGDEHYSFLLTDEGQVVEPAENVPHRYVLTQRTLTDEVERANRLRRTRQQAPRHIGSQATAPLPAIGSPKVPVILVNFTDSVFSVADTDEEINQYYDLYCNGTRDGKRYKGHGSYGSVRDYFVQQSDSLFQPEFVVIGPVTLEQPAGYYGKNSGNSNDVNYSKFRNDAIRAAKGKCDDWSQFDNKGKNQVDMVFIIFAGCGEANGGGEESIWPKESTGSVTMDGIRFATSACCNEMRLNSAGKTTPDGIGIMTHELSHALGLPDFYDINYEGFGMDLWSVMDFGCYANNGYTPCSYTAYERDFMGWRALQELTTPGMVTLTATELGGVGLKIVNDENPNEYYIVENRQRFGWDDVLARMGHGMQVTHVDYNANRWNGNTVNTDANHQRMTIIPANNRFIGTSATNKTAELRETWAGNLYPFVKDGVVVNDSLTALSTPAATVFTDQGFMHKDLFQIRENEDKTISFYFKGKEDTGVQAPKRTDRAVSIFDLGGRNVQVPTRGLYLINGRKMIIR